MLIFNKFQIVRWIITSLFLKYCFIGQINWMNFITISNGIKINMLTNNRQIVFNLVSIKPVNISSEIIINGLNSITLKEKLKSFFKIYTSSSIYITTREIKFLINKLKLSGFFEYVSFKVYYLGNHQVIIIDLVPNPILRKIHIIDYQDKLIPSSYIEFLFYSQLGYPKSFAKISYSITQIINWYEIRGYKWIQIKLEYNDSYSNNLILKINEGKIKKIEIFNYIKHDKHIIKNNFNILNYIIAETFKVQLSRPLNIHSLDNTILKLKLQKITSRCDYKVILSSSHENHLILVLKIEILNKKSTYLFADHIIIPPNFLLSLELLIEYTLEYFLFNNELTNNLLLNNIFSYYSNHSTFNAYASMSRYDNRPYQLLYKRCMFFLYEICEWYLTPLVLIAGDNLGFRHYIKNNNKTCIFDFKLSSAGLYFNLQHENSFVKIFGYDFNLLTFSIFQCAYAYLQNQFPMLLNQANKQSFSHENTIFHKAGIKIKLHNKCGKGLLCQEELSFNRIARKYIILHNYLSWQNINYFINPYSLNDLYSNFKQIYLQNIQYFLCFSIKSTYSKNYFSNHALQKFRLILESIHFMPSVVRKYNNSLNQCLNYSHNIKLKIITTNIINLFSEIINKQIFISTLEIVTSLSSSHHFPFSEIYFLIGPNRIRGYKEQLLYVPDLKLLAINLEYHLFFINDNSIFVFTDFVYILNYIKHSNHISLLYKLYDIDKFYYKIGYGLGLQVKTPIKQIPPLRLEYGFNLHNQGCFHLRINQH